LQLLGRHLRERRFREDGESPSAEYNSAEIPTFHYSPLLFSSANA
jgi:hypothetical protein